MDDFIPTRAAQNKKNAEKLHDVIVFEAHKKKISDPNKIKSKIDNKNTIENLDSLDSDEEMETPNETIDDKRKQELEMKRLRYDVIKFGMSGFEKHKARQAKVALAISLGAKPPKNRKMNYKKLLKKRKEEKMKEAKNKKFSSGFSTSQLTKNKNNEKSKLQFKKSKDEILGSYGKVTKDKSHNKKGGKFRKGKS